MFNTKMLSSRILGGMVLLACISCIAQAQRKKQIAVLDFDFATVDLGLAHRAYGSQQNLARRVADKLVTSLIGLGTCQVIERSQLERVLSEQNLGVGNRLDPSTAAKVGRILGVDALIIGNVSVFDLTGLPKDSQDIYWNPKNMRARIAVNFRVVDTTTAVIEASNEMIGMSAGQPKQSAKSKFASDVLTGILTPKNQTVQVKDEQIRDVVQQAVDDVVSKITVDVETYLSGTGRRHEMGTAPEKLINGRVLSVNGPTVVIAEISRSVVRLGDRLFVRRGIVKRDRVTGKEFRYTEKIGEVEVVEIQDEVIIGSFSGSLAVQEGDLVTNNISGVGSTAGSGATSQPLERNTTPRQRDSNRSKTVTVYGNQAWLDTGIEVKPSMNFQFSVEGEIGIDSVNKVNANGRAGRSRFSGLPMPNAPLGALLAKVRYPNGKDSAVVVVGTSSGARTDPDEFGRLMLGINDTSFADNNGYFLVTIRW